MPVWSAALEKETKAETKEVVPVEKEVPKAPETIKETVTIPQNDTYKVTSEKDAFENKPSGKTEPIPKVPVDNSSVVIDNNVVTDDQFFDDFFSE